MKISNAIKIAAEEVGIPIEAAHKAYYMSWKFIQEKMKELPLKENLTEEQFNSLRPNFNIPELGKFAVTYEKYKKVKRGYEYFLKLKEQLKNDNEDKGNKATVQSTGGD